MAEFASRAEYEKLRSDMIARLRKGGDRREAWVCPECLTSLPGTAQRCDCGYVLLPSLSPHFRKDVISGELYASVRNEFNLGRHETAIVLSRYLVKRFPGSEEARHVREYRERRFDDPANREGAAEPRALHRKTARADRKISTKAVLVIAALACLGLFFALFFLYYPAPRPVMNPPQQGKTPTIPPSNTQAGTQNGAPTYDMTAGPEPAKEVTGSASPLRRSGAAKGREIAKAFLTNKPALIREKCYQAMKETRTKDEEYLNGCLEGYASKAMIPVPSPETQAASAEGNKVSQ